MITADISTGPVGSQDKDAPVSGRDFAYVYSTIAGGRKITYEFFFLYTLAYTLFKTIYIS